MKNNKFLFTNIKVIIMISINNLIIFRIDLKNIKKNK